MTFTHVHELQSPWTEIDLEEAALAVGPDEGLGNNPRLPGWYGGKAEFRGRLVDTKDPISPYKIVLEPCTLGPSSRFTRQFGSFSFLRVKIPLTLFHNPNAKLDEWFKQAFVIWGRIYRACYAKSDNVFLYWTNESLGGGPPVPGRLSFVDFIYWHNPLQANANQVSMGFDCAALVADDAFLAHDQVVCPHGTWLFDFCSGSSSEARKYH